MSLSSSSRRKLTRSSGWPSSKSTSSERARSCRPITFRQRRNEAGMPAMAKGGQATIRRHLSAPGAVLLVSCYELGHQPFTLASPWAQLEAAGFGVAAHDASVEEIADEAMARAWLVAISVPMHTA